MANLNDFLADVPENQPPTRSRPMLKKELTTAHKVKMSDGFKPLTALATSIAYCKHQTSEHAQTVYLLIDDSTPDDQEVDPILAQMYQALNRAQHSLFEAETHVYRYVNKLQSAQIAADQMNALEMFREHAGNVSHTYDQPTINYPESDAT